MKAAGNPWMKFYPSDWRADPALRSCTIAARGLWVEMLCIMHEATPYGSLLIAGARIDKKRLAVLAGIPERECIVLLLELEGFGVFSRDDDGTLYSRRMRRDAVKAEEGRKQIAKRWNGEKQDRSPNRSPNPEPATVPNTQKPETRDAAPPERTPPASPSDPEKELFDRGKRVLGKSAGGQIVNLLKAKGGNVALARAAIEQASTKQNPTEYIAAAIRGSTGPPQFAERETNGFAARLKNRYQENTNAPADREPIDITPNQPGGSMGADRREEFDGRSRLPPPANAGSPEQTFQFSSADGKLPLAGPR